MCGQFGTVILKHNSHADDFIRDSFTASMLRGVDSSGIGSIDMKTGQYLVHKLPVMGTFFTGDTLAKSLILDACTANALTMCHVRAATVGRVSISNAHPFEIFKDGRTIIGTHNGTLTNWTSKKDAKNYSVDSEWALNHIFDEAFDAFEDFTGAFSFVWWDSDKPEELRMARNKERPMSVAFLEDGGMAYASEPGMLFWLLERNSMKIDGRILHLDADKLYKFKLDNVKDFQTSNLPKPATTSYGTSSNAGRGSYSYNHTYTFTTISKVEDLIKTAGETLESQPITSILPDKEPVVYSIEAQRARDYGWLDHEVEFTPFNFDDDGNVSGLCEASGSSFEALVRGDHIASIPWDHTWCCKVLGVQDDDKELLLVLSRPYKTIAPIPDDVDA